jgi:hypothetical protein
MQNSVDLRPPDSGIDLQYLPTPQIAITGLVLLRRIIGGTLPDVGSIGSRARLSARPLPKNPARIIFFTLHSGKKS